MWDKERYRWTLGTISRRTRTWRLCPRIRAVARQATLNSILREKLASYCKILFISFKYVFDGEMDYTEFFQIVDLTLHLLKLLQFTIILPKKNHESRFIIA